MKGFGIYVKNNLLEPKHVEIMDASVWLYLWLLDKMTSVNENGVGKVLNNKPITYELVSFDLGVSRQVYVRWIKRLREAGYINTVRTPKGLCVVVNKAEKIFGNRSIKNETSPTKRSIKSNTPKAEGSAKIDTSDVSKTKQPMRQNRASNKDNTVNNTIDNTSNTNVLGAERHGKPELNEMFDYWAQEVGFNIETRVKQNRFACSSLLKKHGKDKMEQLIKGVAMTHSDPYAPRISDFFQLQQKLPDLLVWGKRKQGETPRSVRI